MFCKKRAVIILLAAILLLGGCSWQTNANRKPDSSKYTTEAEEFWLDTNKDNYDVNVSFVIKGEIEQTVPENPYANTEEDGSVVLYTDITDGTPFDHVGVVYDHDSFDPERYVKVMEGDETEAGGGCAIYKYCFTPKKSGEYDIFLLNTYLVDDTYVGVCYHIDVDESLRCSIAWYGTVRQGENMKVRVGR